MAILSPEKCSRYITKVRSDGISFARSSWIDTANYLPSQAIGQMKETDGIYLVCLVLWF